MVAQAVWIDSARSGNYNIASPLWVNRSARCTVFEVASMETLILSLIIGVCFDEWGHGWRWFPAISALLGGRMLLWVKPSTPTMAGPHIEVLVDWHLTLLHYHIIPVAAGLDPEPIWSDDVYR